MDVWFTDVLEARRHEDLDADGEPIENELSVGAVPQSSS
jgi:hypothetical protein